MEIVLFKYGNDKIFCAVFAPFTLINNSYLLMLWEYIISQLIKSINALSKSMAYTQGHIHDSSVWTMGGWYNSGVACLQDRLSVH